MALKIGDTVQCWTKEIKHLGWGEIIAIGKTVVFVLIKNKLYQADEYYCIQERTAYRATARILKDLA